MRYLSFRFMRPSSKNDIIKRQTEADAIRRRLLFASVAKLKQYSPEQKHMRLYSFGINNIQDGRPMNVLPPARPKQPACRSPGAAYPPRSPAPCYEQRRRLS